MLRLNVEAANEAECERHVKEVLECLPGTTRSGGAH